MRQLSGRACPGTALRRCLRVETWRKRSGFGSARGANYCNANLHAGSIRLHNHRGLQTSLSSITRQGVSAEESDCHRSRPSLTATSCRAMCSVIYSFDRIQAIRWPHGKRNAADCASTPSETRPTTRRRMCVDLDGECLARRDRTLVAPRSQAVAALGQITIATQNAGVLPALLSCLTEIRRLVDAALGVEAAMAGNRPADE
jgi:hypothetical protein